MNKVTLKALEEHLLERGAILTNTSTDVDVNFLNQLKDTLRYHDNMSGEKFKAPSLGNATKGFVIDELGEIRSEIKPRQTYEKVLSTWMKDKIGIDPELGGLGELDKSQKHTFNGDKYSITFAWVSKMIVDSAAVAKFSENPRAFEEDLGRPMQTSDFYKLSEYWEGRTNLLGVPADPK